MIDLTILWVFILFYFTYLFLSTQRFFYFVVDTWFFFCKESSEVSFLLKKKKKKATTADDESSEKNIFRIEMYQRTVISQGFQGSNYLPGMA